MTPHYLVLVHINDSIKLASESLSFSMSALCISHCTSSSLAPASRTIPSVLGKCRLLSGLPSPPTSRSESSSANGLHYNFLFNCFLPMSTVTTWALNALLFGLILSRPVAPPYINSSLHPYNVPRCQPPQTVTIDLDGYSLYPDPQPDTNTLALMNQSTSRVLSSASSTTKF